MREINPNKMYAKVNINGKEELKIINGYKFSADVVTLFLTHDEEITLLSENVQLLNKQSEEVFQFESDEMINKLKYYKLEKIDSIISELEENKKVVIDAIKILKAQQNNTLHDDYDNGFFNGTELALSLLEKREAKFRSK